MDCPLPQCGVWSSVNATRQKAGGVVRYRCCANGHRFRTVERVDVEPGRGHEKDTVRIDAILKLMTNYGAPMKTSQIEAALKVREKISAHRWILLKDLYLLQERGLVTLNRKSTRTLLWQAREQNAQHHERM